VLRRAVEQLFMQFCVHAALPDSFAQSLQPYFYRIILRLDINIKAVVSRETTALMLMPIMIC
jgi:hypothetical protein